MSGASLLQKKCCCGCGCIDDTTTAVISITGTCTDQTECDDADGTYAVTTHVAAADNCECNYEWRLGSTWWRLHVRLDMDAGTWIALLLLTGDLYMYGEDESSHVVCGGPGAYTQHKEITGDIACVAGALVASFSLPGLDVGGRFCDGCTANVTIG